MPRTYEANPATPEPIIFGKSFVYLRTDITEEPAPEENTDPEMKFWSYEQQKITYPEYVKSLPTREEMELTAAETLISAYEALTPAPETETPAAEGAA